MRDNPAVLMGNPTYGVAGALVAQADTRAIDFENRIFPALPGTQVEVDLIAPLLPSPLVYTQTNATEAVINQLPGGLFGRDLAEKLGVPHITAAVIPLLATHAFPMPLLLARSTPGISNRWTYIAAEQLFRFVHTVKSVETHTFQSYPGHEYIFSVKVRRDVRRHTPLRR